jgi:hypothetical protein
MNPRNPLHARIGLWIAWIAVAVMTAALVAATATPAHAGLSECIDATCRIRCPDGSMGSGCVFHVGDGQVYVLTAGHVLVREAVPGGRPTWHDAVRCTFWHRGHESSPIAGRVAAARYDREGDCAVVLVPAAAFDGVLPPAIPIAGKGDPQPVAGDTIVQVGCAYGTWATAVTGHALGYRGNEILFLPIPARGRSGSALFDAAGTRIVGIVTAQEGDQPGRITHGKGTALGSIWGAFAGDQRFSHTVGWRLGGGFRPPCQPGMPCCPTPQQARPAPAWQPQPMQPQQPQEAQPVWPTLPNAGATPVGPTPDAAVPTTPAAPAVDLAPLQEDLATIQARLLKIETASKPKDGRDGKDGKPGPQGLPGVAPQELQAITAQIEQLHGYVGDAPVTEQAAAVVQQRTKLLDNAIAELKDKVGNSPVLQTARAVAVTAIAEAAPGFLEAAWPAIVTALGISSPLAAVGLILARRAVKRISARAAANGTAAAADAGAVSAIVSAIHGLGQRIGGQSPAPAAEPKMFVIHEQSPPVAPQTVTEKTYVGIPTETDELAAYKLALKELERQTPGSVTFLTALESFKRQFLSGLRGQNREK